MRSIIPTLLTAVTLLFTACDNGYDCNLENTAYNRIGFYSSQDSITEALDKINALDIDSLNEGIANLSAVVKPLADFFGRFG